jgi:hypothetical protein
MVSDAQRVLFVLAQGPTVQRAEPVTCTRLFRSVVEASHRLRQHPPDGRGGRRGGGSAPERRRPRGSCSPGGGAGLHVRSGADPARGSRLLPRLRRRSRGAWRCALAVAHPPGHGRPVMGRQGVRGGWPRRPYPGDRVGRVGPGPAAPSGSGRLPGPRCEHERSVAGRAGQSRRGNRRSRRRRRRAPVVRIHAVDGRRGRRRRCPRARRADGCGLRPAAPPRTAQPARARAGYGFGRRGRGARRRTPDAALRRDAADGGARCADRPGQPAPATRRPARTNTAAPAGSATPSRP